MYNNAQILTISQRSSPAYQHRLFAKHYWIFFYHPLHKSKKDVRKAAAFGVLVAAEKPCKPNRTSIYHRRGVYQKWGITEFQSIDIEKRYIKKYNKREKEREREL